MHRMTPDVEAVQAVMQDCVASLVYPEMADEIIRLDGIAVRTRRSVWHTHGFILRAAMDGTFFVDEDPAVQAAMEPDRLEIVRAHNLGGVDAGLRAVGERILQRHYQPRSLQDDGYWACVTRVVWLPVAGGRLGERWPRGRGVGVQRARRQARKARLRAR